MHIREAKQKLVAAAFIRQKDHEHDEQLADMSIDFRPHCDCPVCTENYLRAFLLLCVQLATAHELDVDAILQETKDCTVLPTYVQ